LLDPARVVEDEESRQLSLPTPPQHCVNILPIGISSSLPTNSSGLDLKKMNKEGQREREMKEKSEGVP